MYTSTHRTASVQQCAFRLAALLLLSGLLSSATLPTASVAQDAANKHPAIDLYATHIAAASDRFDVPERWIRAVMQVESAGRVRAVSNAGAMGLMQIMPDTWTELRVRYRLGRDPFDPRANILGGTAYLREMYDRFGSPGFLAAYNAGPGRYEDHLVNGRPLPRETRNYMARLLPMIGLNPHSSATRAAALPDWREAPLFVVHPDSNSIANTVQENRRRSNAPLTSSRRDGSTQNAQNDGVFVAQSRDERTP